MRRVSPIDDSLPPSSRGRQVSLIQAPEAPDSPVVPEAPVSPQVPDGPHADETVPPPANEVAENDESVPPQTFGGNPVELSLLPLYPNHIARHI